MFIFSYVVNSVPDKASPARLSVKSLRKRALLWLLLDHVVSARSAERSWDLSVITSSTILTFLSSSRNISWLSLVPEKKWLPRLEVHSITVLSEVTICVSYYTCMLTSNASAVLFGLCCEILQERLIYLYWNTSIPFMMSTLLSHWFAFLNYFLLPSFVIYNSSQ